MDNRDKSVIARAKDTNDKKEIGVIEDLVYQMSDENRYELQRIKLNDDGIVYRLCYYTCIANYSGLKFAEDSPIMSESDFLDIINKAKKKGWL